ncbi:GTP cyclohydrolase II [Propionibacterium australiense]|uniref:GTP cyclohydrolase-2 n=1 Tax=Propionibacterium australiense TaxID=119981 RepID=A0A383S436_9ACTN|nr:GTP cyclohydrolase II [Propionibacterium australiense]RLP11438.1 GTP cyclohydrolase II RibA [Propionibacterium australiense]RLP12826.1 GTP cyclohydrolase II RibA [Propionibacterium australiense]SYZ32134.1 GTP cyclohydrolase II [Propionibacterium australiense]VEH90830.1 Riboflavin biosynthesis protein ribBA [Propionibacterium australiense]
MSTPPVRHVTNGAVATGTAPFVERTEPVALPTEWGSFTAQCWRIDGVEHMSLVVPVPESGIPLVRVHSECLTGDVLGSHRCDCGEQLHLAMRMVAESGGAIVYLRDQEGRGIGLFNKLRAYRLQEQGLDTVAANEMLGLPAEARSYESAATILRGLGMTRVRLLTNNPLKAAGLRAAGIEVSALEPDQVRARPENICYLRTKRDRMNHLLDLD